MPLLSSRSLESYLRRDFSSVPGMSSRFSAFVSSAILRIQRNAGWSGGVAEIGAFEGRFIIALAFSLSSDERAVAVDLFEWPDPEVEDRFRQRLRKYRMEPSSGSSERIVVALRRWICWKVGPGSDSSTLMATTAVIHWHQTCDSHSLRWRRGGVVCLDDMLSPAYPELATAALEILESIDDWRVFCVIDRESICASAKFLICRSSYAEFYARSLALIMGRNVWRMGAQFSAYKRTCVISGAAID